MKSTSPHQQRPYSVTGHIIDVLNREQFDGTIFVNNGQISEISRHDVAADAPCIMPGFVDSHIHIESTLITPEHYAQLAVRRGVVAIISDPHEIANVAGIEGIDFMIENGKRANFHFHFAAPPCVPCTPFETSGADIGPDDIARLLERDEIYGVGEMMNVPGVINRDPRFMAIIAAAKAAGKPLDGHAPGVTGEAIRKYAAAGISTDHEANTLDEARERLAIGMKVQIREGSAAGNFKDIYPILKDCNGNVMLCSDDKYPDELMNGYIDQLVKNAIADGIPMWNVLEAACITPVKHYHLRHGLLQQGDNADFIVVDNLTDFNVIATYINGKKEFAPDWQIKPCDSITSGNYPHQFGASHITADQLQVPAVEGKKLKVIVARDLSLITGIALVTPKVDNGNVVTDIENDILKVVVLNRYKPAKPQVAFIKGFNLKCGAMASSIAHDSHNIIAIGTNDDDISTAINRIVDLRGGIVIADGNEVSELALPIGGLMSPLDGPTVARLYSSLKQRATSQGCTLNAPFMTMAFMSLPVIPDIKLTDKGLFDTIHFEFTPLFE